MSNGMTSIGHEIPLPDGSGTVDLRTTEGVLSLLSVTTEPCIELVKTLRDPFVQSNMTLWGASVIHLHDIPNTLGERHASKITKKECETVVAYFEEVWEELESNQQWIQTGTLDLFHQELLLCHVPWVGIPLFIKLFMKRGFARLAAFFRASTVQFPCPDVSEHFIMIVDNTRRTLNRMTMKEAEELDMVKLATDPLKYLVKTGVVAQFLRALTVPVSFNDISEYLEFVQCIMRDEELTRKHFSPGTPCGQNLEALLDGTDGWKPRTGEQAKNPELSVVMERLEALQNRGAKEFRLTVILSRCQKCDKSLDSEKKCGRCKKTVYCSRECQKADWKVHKKVCRPDVDGTSNPLSQEEFYWFRKNYVAVMTEVSRVTRSRGLAKKDVVVVLDMKLEPSAVVVTPYKDLVEGDAMPKWGSVMEDPGFLADLQDEHLRMTSNHLLFLYRYDLMDVAVCRHTFWLGSEDGLQLYSDEALSKFPLSNPEEVSTMFARGDDLEVVLWAYRTFGGLNDLEIYVMVGSGAMPRQG